MINDDLLDNDDIIDLCAYNCNLFAYTMLKLPFETFSPSQEQLLDTFYDPDKHYRELLLALGRKSGKTTMAAVLLLFEVYRMLVLHKDPQSDFGLMPKERIYMMLVGPSKEQVQNVSFDYIRSLAESSPYLRNFIKNKTNEEILFEHNICIRCQTSSSRAGRGYSTYLMIYDEIAWYIDNRGNLSGTELYYAMQPNLKPLAPHSRTVLISSPGGRNGIFWELFKTGVAEHVKQDTVEHGEETWRAVYQLPTWESNPKLEFKCDSCPHPNTTACITCKSNELRIDYKNNVERFNNEFGALFVDVVSPAIPTTAIMACAKGQMINLDVTDKDTPRVIGLDPAISGNSYALVMGHLENNIIVVDLIKYWQGTKDYPVRLNIVEDYVEQLYKQFYITHITIDQFQSASTVQHLQAKGIPAFLVPATSKFNEASTTMLINRINEGTIVYPQHKTLINELSFLQRKQTGKSVRFEAASNSSDDIVDALCRVVHTLDTQSGRRISMERL